MAVKILVTSVIEALAELPNRHIQFGLTNLENSVKQQQDQELLDGRLDILIGDSMVSPIDDHLFYGWQPPIVSVNVVL